MPSFVLCLNYCCCEVFYYLNEQGALFLRVVLQWTLQERLGTIGISRTRSRVSFHSSKTAENSRKQLKIVIMAPRKGKKKDDKLSDSESEMQGSSENPRFSKSGTSFSTLKSSGSGKTNPKLLARLIAFAGLLLVTFITRYYTIDLPEHIW